jgi:hypothetical protein
MGYTMQEKRAGYAAVIGSSAKILERKYGKTP